MENLAFEGGGVKSFAYVGCLRALNSMGRLTEHIRFAGASAGSLFATMLASGFTMEQVEAVTATFDYRQLETSTNCITKAWNMWRHYGLHSTDKLKSMISKVLSIKLDPTTMTLGDLFTLQGTELVIVASNISRRCPIYFHHATFPNIRIVDALVASMCFPGYFQPYPIEITLNGTTTVDLFADGGISENYPLWVFNDLAALYQGLTPKTLVDRFTINPKTLGLKLLAAGEQNTTAIYEGNDTSLAHGGITSYGAAVINLLTLQAERADVSPSYIKNSICIDTRGVSALDFEISPTTRQSLELAGESAVRSFFSHQ